MKDSIIIFLVATSIVFCGLFLNAACTPESHAADPDPYISELEVQNETLAAKNHWLRKKLWKARKNIRYVEKRNGKLRHALLGSYSVSEAINLAGATYGRTGTLWRKARCESRLYPRARNRSGASGLFQFLPSTFRSTPYGGFSIWSPYANALAAGWMHRAGRGGEWSCR